MVIWTLKGKIKINRLPKKIQNKMFLIKINKSKAETIQTNGKLLSYSIFGTGITLCWIKLGIRDNFFDLRKQITCLTYHV